MPGATLGWRAGQASGHSSADQAPARSHKTPSPTFDESQSLNAGESADDDDTIRPDDDDIIVSQAR